MVEHRKTKGSMAIIENIYFSISCIKNFNDWMLEKIEKFDSVKSNYLKGFDVFLFDGVEVTSGIKRYPYGFSVKDKFRIYFSSKVGDNYPIYVIISAQYLHLNNVWACLSEIEYVVEKIIQHFDPNFKLVDEFFNLKLSRVDICNHNNFIDLDKYISVTEYNSRVVTRIRNVRPFINLNGQNDQEVSYFRYGSGDICVRFYNKVKEICEQQYKAFFFLRWLDYGLINHEQFEIYDMTYKYNNNYRIDFIFSNIVVLGKEHNELQIEALKVYSDNNMDNDYKYDCLMGLVKAYNLKLVNEIVNVEYQARGDFLRNLKIQEVLSKEELENGAKPNVFDFTNMFSILANSQELYKHLTSEVFRVVDRNSKAKRKRDKKTDKLWELIQCSKILNLFDNVVDTKKIIIYRDYNTEMNKLLTAKKVFKNASHLYYLKNELNYSNVDSVKLFDILDCLIGEGVQNENYLNLKDMLHKQIKYYGQKGVDVV